MAYSEKGNHHHHNHHRAFIEHKHPGAVLRAFNMKCAKSFHPHNNTKRWVLSQVRTSIDVPTAHVTWARSQSE